MKLVTLRSGSRDGRLAVASRDLTRCAPADGIAASLQEALDGWSSIEPRLRSLADEVEAGSAADLIKFDPSAAMAPLPRAWQWLDGSAFDSHGALMSTVFKTAPVPTKPPLMYQGVSNQFYGPRDDIPFLTEEDGIDFEGEFGVVVDDVPMGTDAAEAGNHIRLIVQINDWSLRRIAPLEMKTGFGWVQAKPPCSVAPAAVTPDELGGAWRDHRVDLELAVDWNGQHFGRVSGYPMSSSFAELVAHAARTRRLCAGTIIGSGTVSNTNYRDVGSACIAERRGIETVDDGEASTPFMRFGDTVRMEARGADGTPLFGAIDQRIVRG